MGLPGVIPAEKKLSSTPCGTQFLGRCFYEKIQTNKHKTDLFCLPNRLKSRICMAKWVGFMILPGDFIVAFSLQKVKFHTVLNLTYFRGNNSRQAHTVLNLTFFAGITPSKHAFLARNHLLVEKQVPPKKLPLPGVIPGPES